MTYFTLLVFLTSMPQFLHSATWARSWQDRESINYLNFDQEATIRGFYFKRYEYAGLRGLEFKATFSNQKTTKEFVHKTSLYTNTGYTVDVTINIESLTVILRALHDIEPLNNIIIDEIGELIGVRKMSEVFFNNKSNRTAVDTGTQTQIFTPAGDWEQDPAKHLNIYCNSFML